MSLLGQKSGPEPSSRFCYSRGEGEGLDQGVLKMMERWARWVLLLPTPTPKHCPSHARDQVPGPTCSCPAGNGTNEAATAPIHASKACSGTPALNHTGVESPLSLTVT